MEESKKKRSNREEIEELRETLSKLSETCETLRSRVEDQDSRLAAMEIARPPELIKLTPETVTKAIEEDPYARFEVLRTWNHGVRTLREGEIIRADLSPYLMDWIRAGLLVGVPRDQESVIAQLREEAEARVKKAIAEAGLAQAAAARVEAEAAEARLREAATH